MPIKELDSLLHLLGERKRKLEQEEAESNMEVLLDFLHLSRERKQDELKEVNISILEVSHFGFSFIGGEMELLGTVHVVHFSS